MSIRYRMVAAAERRHAAYSCRAAVRHAAVCTADLAEQQCRRAGQHWLRRRGGAEGGHAIIDTQLSLCTLPKQL